MSIKQNGHLSFAALATVGLLCAGSSAMAQDLPAGLFTEEQAARGAELYATYCAGCHGPELVSSDAEAPTLTGFTFNLRLAGKTIGAVSEIIQTTMPVGGEGTLEMQEAHDLLAFILATNGYAPGEAEMTAESDLSVEIARVQ